MANKIDTGTGGFPTGDNKNLTTYDVGVVQDSPPSPAVPWSAGDIDASAAEQGSSDISKNTRKTLADYLSELTKKNVYHVDAAIVGNPLIKLVDKEGFPVSATDGQANPVNKSHFTDSLQTSYTADLIAAGAASTDPFKIKRGLAPGGAPDGNKLLSTAAPGGILAAPIKTYTAETLKHNLNNQLDQLKKLDNVVIGDGGLVHADKIRELSHATTFSADGGTSKNILHPDDAHNLSLKDSVDYLEADTKKNYYPVFQNALAADTSFKLSTPDGLPSQIIPTRNEAKFVDTSNDHLRSTLSTVSDKYGNVDNFLKGKGTKLASSGDEKNGNTLLRSIGENLEQLNTTKKTGIINEAHPVAKYSKALLNSRFSLNNQYENFSIADTGKTFSAPQFADKYPLGSSLGEDASLRKVTFGKLAQLGPALSLRAGLELFDTENPTGDLSELGAILPGINQTGIERIERSRLEAGNVLVELLENNLEGANPDIVLINPAALSYGSLNNIFDQFSGISNFGMQVLAIALILALSIIMVAVFGLFSIMSKSMTIAKAGGKPHASMPGYDKIGRRTIGSYLGRGSSSDLGSAAGIISAIVAGRLNIWELIGIQPTRNELQECALHGALAFFGIDSDSKGHASAASIIGSSIVAGAQNPGYDSIMARSISRSFLSISDAFKGFTGTSIMGGIKKTLGLIEVLRDSKFMRALNVFSQLGDQVLSGAYDDFVDAKATGGFGKKISQMDAKDFSQVSVQTQNRIKDSIKLAWSASTAPDLFIYPTSLSAAAANPDLAKLGARSPSARSWAADADKKFASAGIVDTRISTKNREDFEEVLDAEYMPFYFHDVRTNEIISFHAFLASLSDDYSASYDSVDAFGRVEAIKTYKNTTRKIGFSFYVAATNHEDFLIMWEKINKLVTLVYPQFTEGKSISSPDGNYNITAPFSQMIGASPMARIRIGDLIQSNYSKFNLARLFGATYTGNTLNGSSSNNATLDARDAALAFRADAAAAAKTAAEAALSARDQLGGIGDLPDGEYVVAPSPVLKISVIVKGVNKVFTINGKTLVLKGEKFALKEGQVPNGWNTRVHGPYDPENPYDTENLFIEFDAGLLTSTLKATPDGHLRIRAADLNRAAAATKLVELGTELASAKAAAEKLKATPPKSYKDEIIKLVKDDASSGNIIAKSFRSAGGRGLAGFIESMSFDWYDKTTWAGLGEDEAAAGKGKRLPKMCKVTISFSPIHDITPGLDHIGSNRAPIYRVGW